VLTKITVYSPWVGVPNLELNVINRPETDLFEVRNIDGLGDVKADVNTTSLGSIAGAFLTGTNQGIRNIVLTLGLDPNWDEWTVSKLRRHLAKYFVPQMTTRLVFETMEFSPVGINGIVESNDPNMFSKDPEHQISIICPYPYFKALDPTVIEASTALDQVAIDYQGNVETGINVIVNQGADGLSPGIVNIGVNGQDYGDSVEVAGLPAGEYPVTLNKHLELNTASGEKYVRRVDQFGNITNLLNYTNIIGSRWPLIGPGSDTFFVWSDSGVQDWTLTYFDLFGSL